MENSREWNIDGAAFVGILLEGVSHCLVSVYECQRQRW